MTTTPATSKENILFGPKARFTSFLARTNQKSNIGLIVSRVCGKLAQTMGDEWKSGPINLMDVGCGEGELTERVFDALLPHIPGLHVIAVDPSNYMTTLFNERFRKKGAVTQGRYTMITQPFFDHPSGDVPQEAQNYPADILFCAHTLYYANEIEMAVTDCNLQLSDNGFAMYIHQSARSQMHKLRQMFSCNDATIRGSDGQPNNNNHIDQKTEFPVPTLEYSSRLYFNPEYKDQFKLLQDLLTNETPRAEWEEVYLKQATAFGLDPSPQGAKNFAETVNVLEFILRDELTNIDAEKACNFIANTQSYIDENTFVGEKPYLRISESIVFVTGSESTQKRLIQAVHSAQNEMYLDLGVTIAPTPAQLQIQRFLSVVGSTKGLSRQ